MKTNEVCSWVSFTQNYALKENTWHIQKDLSFDWSHKKQVLCLNMIQIEDYFKIKGSIFMRTLDNLALLFVNLDDKGRWETKIFFILDFLRFSSDQRGKNRDLQYSLLHSLTIWD